MPGLAVFGITGRMGQSLIRAMRESAEPPRTACFVFERGARFALERAAGPGSGDRGRPHGHYASRRIPGARSRVRRWRSTSACRRGVAAHARACVEARVAYLVGTTGLDAAARAGARGGRSTASPCLIAPNTSVGVAVLTHLLELASAALGPRYDVEISEAHHRCKRDAPSGTALALGEAVAGARGERLGECRRLRSARRIACPREHGSIGFAVIRAGDIVGEHTATFAADGERIELTHRATDRAIFRARRVCGRPNG